MRHADRSIPRRALGRGHRNAGYAGALILLLLIGVAVMLFLMFGGPGQPGVAQKALETKEAGEQIADEIQVRSIMQLVAAEMMSPGRDRRDPLPSMDDLGESARAITDHWGNRFRLDYETDPSRRAPTALITSAGPDGQFDTEDDIVYRRSIPGM
jgi:hypothetical protein